MVRAINDVLRRVPPWAIYLGGSAWAAWLFWLGLTGGLGVEPIDALEREYGIVALQLLTATLVVTPLRRFTGISLMKHRRALGLTAFGFVVAHLSVWAILDVRSLGAVLADIAKRPYITVGMIAFALLVPLAWTSRDSAIRRIGAAAWRRLHSLAYPATLLGVVHFVWLTRGFPTEPLVYFALISGLLLLRLVPAAAPVRRPITGS